MLFVKYKVSPKQSYVDLQHKLLSGDPESQFDLGVAFYNRGDYAEAIKWDQKAADHGHAGVQKALEILKETKTGA